MVALLVAMSIMAVAMTVAMPVWKHNIQRERKKSCVRGKRVHARSSFTDGNSRTRNLRALTPWSRTALLCASTGSASSNQDFATRARAKPGAAAGRPADRAELRAGPGRGGARHVLYLAQVTRRVCTRRCARVLRLIARRESRGGIVGVAS